MIDTLLALWKKEIGLAHASDLLHHIGSIMELFTDEYMKDQNAKNAAIDSLIKLLEDQKTK